MKSGILASSESDPEITPKLTIVPYYKPGSRNTFIFIQFEQHCEMAQTMLLVTDTVMVLLCFLEIHTVIIA
jgi:hypothetical protein